jgi:hypothetical protein
MAKHKWKWKQRWLTCTDSRPMLDYLCVHAKAKASDRKLRLLAVACCRRFWHLLDHESSRLAVETSERYADGLATREELQAAENAALSPCNELHREEDEWAADIPEGGVAAGDAEYEAANDTLGLAYRVAYAAVEVARATGITYAVTSAARAVGFHAAADLQEIESAAVCGLMRDLFANPFRPPPTVAPPVFNWREAAVVRLAAGAYESRLLPSGHLAPVRLGVLADALEDAGASGTQLLTHLRGPGPHVRGCWAVDALLGKE